MTSSDDMQLDTPAMSAPPVVDVVSLDGIPVVTLGRQFAMIQEDNAPRAGDLLLNAAVQSAGQIVVDLQHVEFFGSAFVAFLFRVWKRLKERGGRFALCGLHPHCDEVLSVMHLKSIWPVTADRNEAVNLLRAPGA